MIQSALFIASAPGRKLFLKSVFGVTAAVTGYGCILQYSNYLSQKQVWEERQSVINGFKSTELKGEELKYYPWLRYNQLSNWEYSLVKLKGYFKSERFFVRRARDGKEGYLVFAPFVTAIQSVDAPEAAYNPNVEYSIFVNLGWVPLENKADVQMIPDPVPTIEAPTNPYLIGRNLFTSKKNKNSKEDQSIQTPFLFYTMQPSILNFYLLFHREDLINDPNNENYQPLTEITGLVRRGETSDFFAKRRNWKNDGVFTWIDLNYMSRFFRLFNIQGASTAYIERIVPSYEDGSEILYPVPATPSNFDKPLNTPTSYFNSSLLFGATSGISLLTLLSLLR